MVEALCMKSALCEESQALSVKPVRRISHSRGGLLEVSSLDVFQDSKEETSDILVKMGSQLSKFEAKGNAFSTSVLFFFF